MTVHVDDPELRAKAWPVIAGVRYFHADDDGVTYTVVANDLEHAKSILRGSYQEFANYDGDLVPFDECEITWEEYSAEKAATVLVQDEERGAGRFVLNTYGAGAWFCSEF